MERLALLMAINGTIVLIVSFIAGLLLHRAISGCRGLGWHGSPGDKLVYTLYVTSAIAVFPAGVLLLVELFRAL